MNRGYRALALVVVFICAVAAFGSAQTSPMQISVYYNTVNPEKWMSNPNDVVSPYVQQKFNIKINPLPPSTQSLEERMNLWIASNTLPDVFLSSQYEIDSIIAKGVAAPLDDYVKQMPNLNKYFDATYWPRYKTNGTLYQLPLPNLNLNSPAYAKDPYNPGVSALAMWAREDILKKAGYSFTSIDDIQKNILDKGKKATLADFKLTPALSTPDDFYAMLKKIKALNLTVGGKPVYPLSGTAYNQFHLGVMYGFGWWEQEPNGDVNGYLGLPGAKDWYKYLNKLYTEGLLDADFLIQKPEQLQDKIASGRVAVGFLTVDLEAAKVAMAKTNPNAKIRYIPYPKRNPDQGFYDIYTPGFERIVINKDFKDIPRLTQYFDWLLSDEGLDVLTWGPDSAGLWTMQNGKRVFKDKQLEKDILAGVKGGKGADYYGLYDYTSQGIGGLPFPSLVGATGLIISTGNPRSYVYSYPPRLNAYVVNKNLVGTGGVDYAGKASYGDGGDNANATVNYWWNEFVSNQSAKLIAATSTADFEKGWTEAYQEFLDKGQYAAAVQDMKKWFALYGLKK